MKDRGHALFWFFKGEDQDHLAVRSGTVAPVGKYFIPKLGNNSLQIVGLV